MQNHDSAPTPPPFEQARNQRQQARAAGLDPDYWYAVEHSHRLRPGQVIEVKFWGRSFAVFRGSDGVVRALEDRCAHRQLKLSLGQVEGCNVRCQYHGWTYDGTGKVVDIPHELFGKPMPTFRVGAQPVQERYGLIWLFPGDPARAEEHPVPEIPELSGPPGQRWACVPVDFTWRCHHSMVVENVCDFTHEYLHRKYKPFSKARLTRSEVQEERVLIEYDTHVGGGKISGLFVDRQRAKTNHMTLGFEYPYQWSNTGDKIKHWCFILPIDERTSRVFFLFYFDALRIPFTGILIPQRVLSGLLRVANVIMVRPLLQQDGWAMQAEQEGWERHFARPFAELNPAVLDIQKLTIRKWQEHLDRSQRKTLVRARAQS